MHRLLPVKVRIGLVVLLVLCISSIPCMPSLSVGTLVTLVYLMVIGLALFSWRPLAKRSRWPAWLVDLNGEWKGQLISQWKAKHDDPPLPPIPAQLRIRQNWFTISVMLITDKITSRSRGPAANYNSETGELTIEYFYSTDPKAQFSHENPPQSGCSRLVIDTAKPHVLTMHYSNDRGSRGDGEFEQVMCAAGNIRAGHKFSS